MKKKVSSITGIVMLVAVAIGSYKAYQYSNIAREGDLFLANVEALSVSETNTTWSCSGTPSDQKCEASCGICLTKISGTGALTGGHSCSK